MCGIAGVVGRWDGADLQKFRDAAYRIMARRGPNDHGAVVLQQGRLSLAEGGDLPPEADALLVHTRLSILDLTKAGAQPMMDSDGRHALVFNGEIYNYEALRAQLQLSADSLRGSSDTEVLLHWLRSKGATDLYSLVGMFAFAFLDANRGTVLLARDGYGIKPLFVARRGKSVAFASDLRVLLELPGVSRRVETTALLEGLRYGGAPLPARQTVFQDLQALLPGEVALIDAAKPNELIWKRWYRPSERSTYAKTFEEAAKEVRNSFLESVAHHLKSDVRVGCALSGGIDSSAIVMAMRHILGARAEIHTVSHIASSSAKSEEKWVDVVNAAAQAIPHKVHPTAEEMMADLDELIATQSEPFGTTSIYAQFRVFREAKEQGLTVMLDGQGADELLGGYSFFLSYYLIELLRQGRVRAAKAILLSKHLAAKTSVRDQILLMVRQYLPVSLSDRLGALVGVPGMPPWVHVPKDTGDYLRRRTEALRRRRRGLKHGLVDAVESQLVGLLRYEDRNSMHFSIESRVPFLSNRFGDLVLSMPPHFIIGPNGQSKYVFREAMRGLVPDRILDRMDKIGFENEEAVWLQTARPWAEAVLQRSRGRCGLMDHERLQAAWQGFLSGRTAGARQL
jgi:asparagine synthase (glutamine-hydrolysing)